MKSKQRKDFSSSRLEIGNLSEREDVLYGGPVPSPIRVGATPQTEVADAVFFDAPQAIALDWCEMHFRLKDPGRFGQLDTINDSEKESKIIPGAKLPADARKNIKAAREAKEKVNLKSFTLVNRGYGTGFYQDIFNIWSGGKIYGEILVNPRNEKQIKLDDVQIKVSNNRLYESGWLDTLKLLAEQLELKWHNFTKLDTCIDGGHWRHVWAKLQREEIFQIGRATRNQYSNHKGEVTGFYLGMSKSKKRLKCYIKSAELKRSNKTYIENWWKLNGIPTDKPVERLEMSMFNEELKKFEELDWEKLDEQAHLAALMRSNMEKFCEFRIPSGGKNRTRWKKYEFINWDNLQAQMMDKDSTRATNEIWTAKNAMRCLFEISLKTKLRHYEAIAWEIALNSDLIRYYEAMKPRWEKNFNIKSGHNRQGLITDSWIHTYHVYNPGEQIQLSSHEEERAKYLAAAKHLN